MEPDRIIAVGLCSPEQRPTSLQTPLARQTSNIPTQAPASGVGGGKATPINYILYLIMALGLVTTLSAAGLALYRRRKK